MSGISYDFNGLKVRTNDRTFGATADFKVEPPSMHPTSGTHPSHRWFHTDEDGWRCACGIIANQFACDLYSPALARRSGFWSQATLDGTPLEGYRLCLRMTEKQICEWAECEQLDQNWQSIPEDRDDVWYFDRYMTRYGDITLSDIQSAEEATACAAADGSYIHKALDDIRRLGPPPSDVAKIIERYHQTGGIVRHGCEERK